MSQDSSLHSFYLYLFETYKIFMAKVALEKLTSNTQSETVLKAEQQQYSTMLAGV